VQPAHAAITKPRTRGMSHNQEVPAIIENFPNVALNMAIAVVLGWQQIAGPSIMALFQKRIAHYAGEFTGDKYTQGFGAGVPSYCGSHLSLGGGFA
jgi:hypothetical protein